MAAMNKLPNPLGKKFPQTRMMPLQGQVDDLARDGAGVVEVEDKVYAVDRVLPGEWVEFEPRKKRRGKLRGDLIRVIKPSEMRVEPRCEYFGVCGGCAQQHIAATAQLTFKEKNLFTHLTQTADALPQQILEPIHGAVWNYRRKARVGIRDVPKKGGILVGFRERNRSYITALMRCHTLDARLSDLLPGLHELLEQSSCRGTIPQIEMAAADNAIALVLRHMQPLDAADIALLTRFAKEQAVQIFLQPGGPDTIKPLWPETPEALFYRLDDYDLKLHFAPTDFIQVNGEVNALMVKQAMDLLRPTAGDSILDLFCGIGNFTLPIARSQARVLGVEGDAGLTERGAANAAHNHLANAEFLCMDLYHQSIDTQSLPRQFDKVLLDPPRSGAEQVITQLIPTIRPRVIVYVSCNPATLARDADTLLRIHGYHMTHVGIIDMFPHTAQVESVARFER